MVRNPPPQPDDPFAFHYAGGSVHVVAFGTVAVLVDVVVVEHPALRGHDMGLHEIRMWMRMRNGTWHFPTRAVTVRLEP